MSDDPHRPPPGPAHLPAVGCRCSCHQPGAPAAHAVPCCPAPPLDDPDDPGCGPHRLPEGPNEDVAQCPRCWGPTWTMRPDGETFGDHLPDCSLPRRHEARCRPGGTGHSRAGTVRG